MSKNSSTGRIWFGAALAASLVMICGCSKHETAYPVRGRVLFKGHPAVGARVTFYPKEGSDPYSTHPSGVVGEDGSFSLTTRKMDDGAPAGDYVVTVVWPDKSTGGRRGSGDQHDRLKNAFSNPDKSQLRVKVVQGDNELPVFELH